MAEGNGRQWSGDIKEIGDRIAALTVSKAVELGDYLEEVHKIKPAAGGVVMAAGPAGGGGAAVAEKPAEKTEFTVQLDGFDAAKKINVIKVVREITGLGLKEAKDLVEGSPKPVKENISKDEAEKFKKQLEDGGAKVSLK
jgi:large subunit ribosomal protein L7/L12